MDTTYVIKLITGSIPSDGLDIRLLASPVAEGVPIVPDSLVEVSFPGYEALRPEEWDNLEPAGEDGAVVQTPIMRIVRETTGELATVNAYAVTADTEDGRVVLCAANLVVPMTVLEAGESLRFRITIAVYVVPPQTEDGDTTEAVTSMFEEFPSWSPP